MKKEENYIEAMKLIREANVSLTEIIEDLNEEIKKINKGVNRRVDIIHEQGDKIEHFKAILCDILVVIHGADKFKFDVSDGFMVADSKDMLYPIKYGEMPNEVYRLKTDLKSKQKENEQLKAELIGKQNDTLAAEQNYDKLKVNYDMARSHIMSLKEENKKSKNELVEKQTIIDDDTKRIRELSTQIHEREAESNSYKNLYNELKQAIVRVGNAPRISPTHSELLKAIKNLKEDNTGLEFILEQIEQTYNKAGIINCGNPDTHEEMVDILKTAYQTEKRYSEEFQKRYEEEKAKASKLGAEKRLLLGTINDLINIPEEETAPEVKKTASFILKRYKQLLKQRRKKSKKGGKN
jgi:chromosome segregation ATPase